MLKLMLIGTLLATSAAASAQTPERSDDAKLRCKRFEETGSFVKKRRVCLTEKQWRDLQAETDRELRAMSDAARVNPIRPDE